MGKISSMKLVLKLGSSTSRRIKPVRLLPLSFALTARNGAISSSLLYVSAAKFTPLNTTS